MVSKKEIKSLDFVTMEEYMDYIVESHVNGNFNQCQNLIDKFSKEQKKEFIEYLDCNYPLAGNSVGYCKQYVFKKL